MGHAPDFLTLLIGKVKDGSVDKWNKRVGLASYERVRRGDRIITVNGCGNDSDVMLQARTESVLTLKIRRIVEFRVVVTTSTKAGLVAPGRAAKLGVELEEGCKRLIMKAVLDGPVRELNKQSKADME